MNDVCGACWYQGSYHLYFQHNPFGVQWNNMSWGHAVSSDLLHWQQLEEALLPEADGPAFTGSAILHEGCLLYTSFFEIVVPQSANKRYKPSFPETEE